MGGDKLIEPSVVLAIEIEQRPSVAASHRREQAMRSDAAVQVLDADVWQIAHLITRLGGA